MRFKIKPWDHQKKAIERSMSMPEFALFFEMGTGKTATAINILRIKFAQDKKLLKTLILAPPITLENWKREWLAHSFLRAQDVHVLYGPIKKRIEKLRQIETGVVITNYQALALTRTGFAAELAEWGPACLVLDESHRCKGNTQTTKSVFHISKGTRYRLLLTGTPILNTTMDIFHQYRILDHGKTFGKNFIWFREKYFRDLNKGMPPQKYFPNWQPIKEKYPELTKKIYWKAARVRKEECLDLPPLIKNSVYVEMSKDQEKAYKEMRDAFVAYIQSKYCVASLAITKALRLQQIISGFAATDDGGVVHFESNQRAEALRETIQKIGPMDHKIIIWAVFKDNYSAIRKVLEKDGINYVEIHGGITGKKKFEAVDAFNTDDSVRVIIGHPGSGGIGINLVAASHAIFYSRGFSLEHDLQAEARNYRGGSEQHDQITRIDLIAKDTIDERILEALEEKKKTAETVLDETQTFDTIKNIAGRI